MAGETVLIAADMTNRTTDEAKYDSIDIETLLAGLRAKREKLVARFEELGESGWPSQRSILDYSKKCES
ncbi:MAG: hypothetical protein CMJ64_06575 [Planctomycetaceae bacterium]|nr:hypothetical protein [Planctomycetaceae bacterium]